MKKLIAFVSLLAILATGCAEGGPNPLQPPTPRPPAATEVARPPVVPTQPGNPPSNPTAVPANPPSGNSVSATCPDLATMRGLAKVDVTKVGSEPCAYTYNRGDGKYLDTVGLPNGYYITTAEADEKVYTQRGDGNTRNGVKAATWRLIAAYPGLSLEQQTQLTKDYAPGAGYSPDIVICRGCGSSVNSGGTGAPAAAAPQTASPLSPCPTLSGVQTTPIPGGCLWHSTNAKDLVIPSGVRAHWGDPARDSNGPTTIPGITDASLYAIS